MLKPLDSWAELCGLHTFQLRGRPTASLGAGSRGPSCDSVPCMQARQPGAPEAPENSDCRTAWESGKGQRANFSKGDKLGEARLGP